MKNKGGNGILDFYEIDETLLETAQSAEAKCRPVFADIEGTAEYNQYKVIKAFQKNNISENRYGPRR